MVFIRFTLAALLVALSPAPASAQTPGDLLPFDELVDRLKSDEDTEIIQNRKYELDQEITLAVGVMPSDPFNKGITFSAGWTWHFHSFFAWEVGNFTYAVNFASSLRTKLERRMVLQGQQVPNFPAIEWILASRLVFTPFYGKEALLNTDVVHLEAYVSIGPDWMYVQQVVGNRGRGRDRLDIFGFDVGGGIRLHFTEIISVRLDLSEIIFFVPRGVKQALHVRLGAAFNLSFEE